MYIYIHTYIHIYIHIYTYIYTYIYICIYMSSLFLNLLRHILCSSMWSIENDEYSVLYLSYVLFMFYIPYWSVSFCIISKMEHWNSQLYCSTVYFSVHLYQALLHRSCGSGMRYIHTHVCFLIIISSWWFDPFFNI
jgi:hypothetical protein